MSSNLVPLTVYKGAGHEHIPFVAGSPHITADFHSIRTKTDAPAYVTSGFYKVEAGPKLSAHYAFEEISKEVIPIRPEISDNHD